MTDGLEYLGWVSTFLVLVGFWANSKNKRLVAFIAWILGDIGWIIYDVYISNWSHMTLSAVIIGLNVFGIYNNKNDNKTISKGK
jgi:hypothetical protein